MNVFIQVFVSEGSPSADLDPPVRGLQGKCDQ